jgi:hypothetical protein
MKAEQNQPEEYYRERNSITEQSKRRTCADAFK